MLSCPQDTHFGPASTCRTLDFTLYFEQCILSLTPDVVFLALVSAKLFIIWRQSNKLERVGRELLAAKCLAMLSVTCSTAITLAYSIVAINQGVLPVWIAAPVVQAVTPIPLAAIVVLEHFKSTTPSSLIVGYSLLKALFTMAHVRTYKLISLFHIFPGLAISTTVVAAAYVMLACAELIEKRKLLRIKTLPHVSTSSFLSRSSYIWLLPLLWSGRNKVLRPTDLGAIPAGLSAFSTRSRLQNALLHTQRQNNQLVFASLKTFGWAFCAPILPRIALLLATFAQPLLVNTTIKFVSDPDRTNAEGWALVGGFICVYATIVLTTSLYWEKVFDATVQYRAALVGVIYGKTLRLASDSARALGGGAASTYMSVDVERICEGMELVHEMWSSVASIGLAVVVLYDQASWPAFLPIGVTLLLMLTTGYYGRKVGRAQARWMKSTDRRVKFLASVLNHFLSIKWSGYENVIAKKAYQLRAAEMAEARYFYYSLCISISLSNSASTACILSVLGPYAILAVNGGLLNPARLFTIVTTANLLTAPLNLLGQTIPTLAAAWASLLRIQRYLDLEETKVGLNHPYEVKADKSELTPIVMESASFSWSPDTHPYLQRISIRFDKPELYMCIGRVASGKSLLLLSILGETMRTEGQYSPPRDKIAYAVQEPLIFPGTIRDNILFGQSFDEEWYNRVIEACALSTDLRRMDVGDGTLLGDKGGSLSGGQRQRVALARAVYARAAWTLLDDPFSALDAQTEVHVFQSLFGPSGLLKNKGVILVTHNLHHLSAANHIMILDSGKIQCAGSFEDIRAQGYIREMALIESKEKQKNPVAAQSPEEYKEEQEVAEAPIANSSLGFTPYKFFARKGGLLNVAGALGGVVFLGLVRLGLQLYLRQWSASDGTHVGAWVGGYAGLTVFFLLGTIVSLYQYSLVVTTRVGQGVHTDEIQGLFNTAPSYIMSTPVGRIINRFSQDIFRCDFHFPISFLNVLTYIVQIAGLIVFIVVPVPWLTLALIPIGLLYYAPLKFYLLTSKQIQAIEASSKSPLYTLFSASISGLVTIRAIKAEERFQQLNDAYLDSSQRPFFFRFGGIRFLRTLLSLVSFFLSVGLAALAIGLRHKTNPSSLGLALSSITTLTTLLTSLLINLSTLENASIAISRIHEIVKLPPEKDSKAKPEHQGGWLSEGRVNFEGVELRYRPELNPVVKSVSFSIHAGQKVGICGRSGSGKSSLIMALFRALDESLVSGKISIDGVDIQSIPLVSFRQALSLVAQDAFLWHSSLRENLDPEGVCTDKDIWMNLERVGMHEAVSALPGKLDAIMEDGGSLSKGQRQLLCLARVLLRKRKIVVLDEASSSLDADTDQKMREVVRSDLLKCTVIAVAHRIATIIDFDWILVMEDGVLIEQGTPADLLMRQDSSFAQLAAKQGLRAGDTKQT